MKRLIYRLRDVLLTVVILLFVGLVAVRFSQEDHREVSGVPRVVDGDTLVLGGMRIRLVGIDAPELKQLCHRHDGNWTCGAHARDHLIKLIDGEKAMCAADGSDRYGRLLAVCTVNGVDLNNGMVSSGYAIAFGDYEPQEDEAKRNSLGLWAGTFDTPQTWRRTHGEMDEPPHIGVSWPMRDMGGRLWEFVSGLAND